MEQTPCHVLIIGAGICGLAIAQGLKKAGIRFTIFEAEEDPTLRPREWTTALHWSIPMLRSLLPDDLAARLKEDTSVDPSLDFTAHPNNAISIYDGPSGKLIKDISSEGEFLRVSRRKLRELCKEEISVKYGHSLCDVSIGPGDVVTATFDNGASHTGSLIVGTDGTRSRMREVLFGTGEAAPTPLGVVYINIAFKYDTAEQARFVRSANPVTSFMVHPDLIAFISIQDGGDPEKPETWRFQIVMSWRGSLDNGIPNDEKHRIVKKKADVLAEPFHSAIQWMPATIDLRANDLSGWVPEVWDTHGGRGVLAGDAAHSMPPNRGQSLNHAINDAFNFVCAASKIFSGELDQMDAMTAYTAEVVERGAKEVKLSKETANLTLDYDKFMTSPLIKHGLERSPSA